MSISIKKADNYSVSNGFVQLYENKDSINYIIETYPENEVKVFELFRLKKLYVLVYKKRKKMKLTH